MKPEGEIPDFTIYENERQIAEYSIGFFRRHLTEPLIFINTRVASISALAQQKIGIREGEFVAFAETKTNNYIALLPMNSSIRGYKVQSMANTKSLYINSGSIIKKGYSTGPFKVGKSIFYKGIDWFELEPFIIPNP